jgi:hypothetical protein
MAQLNNIKSVSVPSLGKLPLAANPGTFVPSGTQRAHKPGRLAEDGGFTSTNQGAKLDLNINLLSGIDLVALNAVENEDITIRLADGHVHMMSQAFVVDPMGIEDGESKITFMSNSSELIV